MAIPLRKMFDGAANMSNSNLIHVCVVKPVFYMSDHVVDVCNNCDLYHATAGYTCM